MRGTSPPCRLLVRAAMFAALVLAAPSSAMADDVCTLQSATGLRVAVEQAAPGMQQRPELLYAFSRLPVGGMAQFAVAGKSKADENSFATLRVLVTDTASAADQDRVVADLNVPFFEKSDRQAMAAYTAALRDVMRGAAAAVTRPDGGADGAPPVQAEAEVIEKVRVLAAAAKNMQQREATRKAAIGQVATEFADGMDVSPSWAASDNPLVLARRIETDSLLVNFMVPSPYPDAWMEGSRMWRWMNVVVIACDASGKAVFISLQKQLPMSGRLSSIGLALIPGLIIYGLVALAARRFDNDTKADPVKPKSGRMGVLQMLDPVWMTSGPDSRGSLARLQILFFTVLLAYILAFLIFRVGLLSDMSQTVLYLLGISAVGAAAAKATDGAQTRLQPENWAWLVSRQWLPLHGLGRYRIAKWRDLVTSEDGFDVYHFQMLVFSLVVAIALLQAGYSDIASFTIPASLLGVLGLSQAAYVGGKLVAPPSYGDLDRLLTDLRGMEDTYIGLCAREAMTTDPAAKATLMANKDAAVQAYRLQMAKVVAYFPTVFGTFEEIRRMTQATTAPDVGLPCCVG